MAVTLKYRFAMRRWSTTGWAANDEILLNSEWAYDTTTGRLKIGDGTHLYSVLPFVSTTNFPEGTNLYFTAARVNAALVAGDGVSLVYNAGETTISITGLPIYLFDEAGNQLTDESSNFLIDSATSSLPVAFGDILGKPTTVSGYGITDAQVVGLPVKLPTYTLLGLPSAASNPDALVVCTNLTEGRRVVYSDGTNWRRLTDNTVAN